MSSKHQPDIDAEALPSYTDAITSTSHHLTSNSKNQPHHIQANIQTKVHGELLTLAARLSSTRDHALHQLHRDDEAALSLLLPHIKAFLAAYSATTLPSATLILIPATDAAVANPLAVPALDDLRSADDFGRVVRVGARADALAPAAAAASSEKGGARAGAGVGGGRGGDDDDAPLEWNTPEMTARLASYLQPSATPSRREKGATLPSAAQPDGSTSPSSSAMPTTASPSSSSKKSSSLWWRKKNTTATTPATTAAAAAAVSSSRNPKEGNKAMTTTEELLLPKVTMAVRAEEVVFRAESELGLWENETVWGIVVRVRVNSAM